MSKDPPPLPPILRANVGSLNNSHYSHVVMVSWNCVPYKFYFRRHAWNVSEVEWAFIIPLFTVKIPKRQKYPSLCNATTSRKWKKSFSEARCMQCVGGVSIYSISLAPLSLHPGWYKRPFINITYALCDDETLNISICEILLHSRWIRLKFSLVLKPEITFLPTLCTDNNFLWDRIVSSSVTSGSLCMVKKKLTLQDSIELENHERGQKKK